jgi:hypothetical protein
MDNRYMIVKYIKKPDGKYDEVTEFKRHYRTTDIQTSKVILDFEKKTVIKNGLNPDAGYDDMIEFYKRMLGDRLTPYLPED